MKNLILVTCLLALIGCASSPDKKSDEAPASLAEIVKGTQRSDENKARDIYRHPQETLEFFEVKNDMQVVEIWPGGGWYTEILAPYLKDKGVLIAAAGNPESKNEYRRKGTEKFKAKLATHPEWYGKVKFAVFEPPTFLEVAPANSVDRILTFRNVHNWMSDGPQTLPSVFKSFYTSLKPGGILGIEEHRGKKGSKQDPLGKSGYVNEAYLIQVAEKAGFKLAGKSEINANPKDTKNHPEGVWTLPPSLKLGEKNKAKYLEIGESDRMTLKFVKPAQGR